MLNIKKSCLTRFTSLIFIGGKIFIIAIMFLLLKTSNSQDEEINFFNAGNITNVPFFYPANFTGGEIYFALSQVNSGKNDIAVALNSSDGIVSGNPTIWNYYRKGTWNSNNGNGGFGNTNNFYINETYPPNQNINIVNGCVFVQLRDNESRKDLIVGKDQANGLWVHWNNGSIGNLQQTVNANVTMIDKGKFDNSDNREDIVIKDGNQIKVFKNLGNGYLETTPFTPITVAQNSNFSFKIKQMNDKDYDAGYWPNNENDKADLIVLDRSTAPPILKVYINTNSNSFGTAWQTITVSPYAKNIEVADMDADGYNDIIVSTQTGFQGSIKIYKNVQGSFILSTPIWVYESQFGSYPYGNTITKAGDVNKDGWNDLVTVEYERVTKLFLNTKNSPIFGAEPDQDVPGPWRDHRNNIIQIDLSDIYNTGGLALVCSDLMNHTDPIMIQNSLKVLNAINYNPKPQPVVIKGDLYFDGTFYRPRITVNTNRKEKDYQTYAYAKYNRDTRQTTGFFLNSDVYIDYSEYVLPGGAGPDWNRYYYVQQIDQTNQISINSNQVNFMVGAQGSGCAGCEGGDMPNTNNTIETPNIYRTTNFPNPFNPVTKIYYTLPVSGNVKIEVYNLVGQKLQVLQNEFKEIGSYILEFDGSNLSSGLYFYRIESGSYSETKKMLLIK